MCRIRVWCLCSTVRTAAITATVISLLYAFALILFAGLEIVRLAGYEDVNILGAQMCSKARHCDRCIRGHPACHNRICHCEGKEVNSFDFALSFIFVIQATTVIAAAICLVVAVSMERGDRLVLIWLVVSMVDLTVSSLLFIVKETVDEETTKRAIFEVVIFGLALFILDLFLIYVWVGVLNYYWILKARRLGDPSYEDYDLYFVH